MAHLGLAFAFLLVPLSALAESTTGTAVTIEGRPIQGKPITIVVHVTGSHLVYGGRGTAFGGYVSVSAQGQALYREMITVLSTPITKSVTCGVYDPQGPGCIDVLFGQETTIRISYVVPKGLTQLQLAAKFEGDNESHGSTAAPLLVPTINPAAVLPAVNLLLN